MLNHPNEIWKDIEDFEERYQVSNLGRVRSIRTNHGAYQERLIPLRERSETCKYYYAQLWKLDKPYTFAVHRLVAKAFVLNPDQKPMVNHIDGNKLNNNACNLEWVTCSENFIHAFQIGLRSSDAHTKRMKGTKFGKTSQYHNVTWDATRQKWKATLKDKKKMVFQKRFDCEHIAARYVNEMLDSLGYSDRPRNVGV